MDTSREKITRTGVLSLRASLMGHEAARHAALFWAERQSIPIAQYEQLGAVSRASLDEGEQREAQVPSVVGATIAGASPDAPPALAPPPPPGWRVVDGAAIDHDHGVALLELQTPTGPVRVVQAWNEDHPGDWIPARGLGCAEGEIRFVEVDGEVWTTQLVADELSWGRWSVVQPPLPGQP
jgi:hypothetical protein